MRAGMIAVLLVVLAPALAGAQQVADTSFAPPIANPAFAPGTGPAVLIDEAHFNFHTSTGGYRPFAELLRRDGFVVHPSTSTISADGLKGARVLVISNALHERNQSNWKAPVALAFTPGEVSALREWILGGGSLLLIADHAPFATAAEQLGKALGIRFLDGWVRRKEAPGPIVFRKADGTLKAHPVTDGIDEVATFTGSSFELDVPGHPLLVFGPETYSFETPDQGDPVAVSGRLQGALLTVGKGRIAVFGEAAMFSAQLAGPEKRPMGMNAPVAKQNPQFLLNVMRWLAGS